MNLRQLFFQHSALTAPTPLGIEIQSAQGNYLYDQNGKSYLDLISGISVAHIGHGQQSVIDAIVAQARNHMHVMVYGELIQKSPVVYAAALCENLPENLDNVYFTNSGAEAVEGAIKLAKRYTKKAKIIAANRSYHGSTTGALSLLGDEHWRNAFRPLMPGIDHFDYGSTEMLDAIDQNTAAIFLESIQGEAGVNIASNEWMQAVRKKCSDTGTLLVMDEIQTGFGRTGKQWAFEHFEIVPDVLLLGKALGGGMPLGAFISSKEIMSSLSVNPILGHISTFAGHPVSCAAGFAAYEFFKENISLESINLKGNLFKTILIHPQIKNISQVGLFIALHLTSFDKVTRVIEFLLKEGIFTDWFLFADNAIRIAPPYTITEDEIEKACAAILNALDALD